MTADAARIAGHLSPLALQVLASVDAHRGPASAGTVEDDLRIGSARGYLGRLERLGLVARQYTGHLPRGARVGYVSTGFGEDVLAAAFGDEGGEGDDA